MHVHQVAVGLPAGEHQARARVERAYGSHPARSARVKIGWMSVSSDGCAISTSGRPPVGSAGELKSAQAASATAVAIVAQNAMRLHLPFNRRVAETRPVKTLPGAQKSAPPSRNIGDSTHVAPAVP